jgi:hypothetical protein
MTCLAARPQVGPLVVQAIAVDVMRNEALGRPHDLAVHEYRLTSDGANGVALAVEAPSVPVHLVKVGIVDEGE